MKYKLENSKVWPKRIIALKDFADVKKGDVGGFIGESAYLDQEGTAGFMMPRLYVTTQLCMTEHL